MERRRKFEKEYGNCTLRGHGNALWRRAGIGWELCLLSGELVMHIVTSFPMCLKSSHSHKVFNAFIMLSGGHHLKDLLIQHHLCPVMLLWYLIIMQKYYISSSPMIHAHPMASPWQEHQEMVLWASVKRWQLNLLWPFNPNWLHVNISIKHPVKFFNHQHSKFVHRKDVYWVMRE